MWVIVSLDSLHAASVLFEVGQILFIEEIVYSGKVVMVNRERLCNALNENITHLGTYFYTKICHCAGH